MESAGAEGAVGCLFLLAFVGMFIAIFISEHQEQKDRELAERVDDILDRYGLK